jgi:hypothetical protein
MTLLPAGYRRASMPEDPGAIEGGSLRRESDDIGAFECLEIHQRDLYCADP